MKVDKIIFEDLQKYLKKKGIESSTEDELIKANGIGYLKVNGIGYRIRDGAIHFFFGEIVSLADPQYREKFYKFISLER